jgi:hypothetical protein
MGTMMTTCSIYDYDLVAMLLRVVAEKDCLGPVICFIPFFTQYQLILLRYPSYSLSILGLYACCLGFDVDIARNYWGVPLCLRAGCEKEKISFSPMD